MSSDNNLQSFSESNEEKIYSGGDLFTKNSFLEKTEGKGYTNYALNEEYQYEMTNDLAYFILSYSKFIIGVKYDETKNMTIIDYKEIICKNHENEKINIESIKNFSSEVYNLNICYEKFNNYLTNLENELKEKYKKEEETEIILEIKKKGDDYNKVDCKLSIEGGTEELGKESSFLDEDILNNNTHIGIGCLIEAIE